MRLDFELFRWVREFYCAIKHGFFDGFITSILNKIGATMHWLSSTAYQRLDLLYIVVTISFYYLGTGIESKCKSNNRITSKKIFFMAGMNVKLQIGKNIFVMIFLFESDGTFPKW